MWVIFGLKYVKLPPYAILRELINDSKCVRISLYKNLYLF